MSPGPDITYPSAGTGGDRRGSGRSGRIGGWSARGRRRAGSRRGSRRAGYVVSLNLTPMIDTVFNLLFFFMMVSRFGALEGMLEAKLPARTGPSQVAAAEIPRTPIRIRIVADPKTPGACRAAIERLAETPMDMKSLAAALGRIRRDVPGFDSSTPVYLLAGDDVIWDHVVNAYNAAVTAQYERIFFGGSP